MCRLDETHGDSQLSGMFSIPLVSDLIKESAHEKGSRVQIRCHPNGLRYESCVAEVKKDERND